VLLRCLDRAPGIVAVMMTQVGRATEKSVNTPAWQQAAPRLAQQVSSELFTI